MMYYKYIYTINLVFPSYYISGETVDASSFISFCFFHLVGEVSPMEAIPWDEPSKHNLSLGLDYRAKDLGFHLMLLSQTFQNMK